MGLSRASGAGVVASCACVSKEDFDWQVSYCMIPHNPAVASVLHRSLFPRCNSTRRK